MVSKGREFRAVIVVGKNECRYCEVRIPLDLRSIIDILCCKCSHAWHSIKGGI